MCAHKQQNREGMLNIFQDFRNWLKHHILFPLACYPFAAYLKFFLPFIDFDGSKFPWLCSFHISSKGPFSFWISPASYLLQTATRHVKDIFGTPTRQPLFLTGAFQNLPQSSTFLQILYHWPHRKGKKALKRLAIAYRAEQERQCFLLLICLFAWGCFLLPYSLHTSSERQGLSF